MGCQAFEIRDWTEPGRGLEFLFKTDSITKWTPERKIFLCHPGIAVLHNRTCLSIKQSHDITMRRGLLNNVLHLWTGISLQNIWWI